MTKNKLNTFIDKYVEITNQEGRTFKGILGLTNQENSNLGWYRYPANHYLLNNDFCFRANYVKKIKVVE